MCVEIFMRELAAANERKEIAMSGNTNTAPVMLWVRIEGRSTLTMERAQRLGHRFTLPLEEVMKEVEVRISFNGKRVADGILVSLGNEGVGVTMTKVVPPESWAPKIE